MFWFWKGVLRGFDQTINLILDDSYERVFSMNGVEQVKLGVFIVRGDNVYIFLNILSLFKIIKTCKHWTFLRALVGEVDDELDKQIDLSMIKAEPLQPIVH